MNDLKRSAFLFSDMAMSPSAIKKTARAVFCEMPFTCLAVGLLPTILFRCTVRILYAANFFGFPGVFPVAILGYFLLFPLIPGVFLFFRCYILTKSRLFHIIIYCYLKPKRFFAPSLCFGSLLTACAAFPCALATHTDLPWLLFLSALLFFASVSVAAVFALLGRFDWQALRFLSSFALHYFCALFSGGWTAAISLPYFALSWFYYALERKHTP